MSPKMPKEYFEFRKEQILKAAWKSFAENGYDQTTMRHIANSLGFSTGDIYNYFKNKDEILDALLEWIIESQNMLFQSMATKGSTKEAILELFYACFECCPFEELQLSVKGNINMWAEGLHKKKIMELINYQSLQSGKNLKKLIYKGIQEGEIRTDLDPQAVTRYFLALITGIQVQAVMLNEKDFSPYYAEVKKILFQNIWYGNN